MHIYTHDTSTVSGSGRFVSAEVKPKNCPACTE